MDCGYGSEYANPNLSAKEHLNGTFDFNRTPLALLGTRIVLHKKRPNAARGTLTVKTVGTPAMHQNPLNATNVASTAAARIVGIIEFFPNPSKCQKPSPPTQLSSLQKI
jgi:hypothetical protein